ncbi:hypothetical protein NG895_21235 [Aeoliella sp. ICT_H6.2]|uniref:ParE-like toxin domain-containing protein n=1 Tax=Aeoliella straminimaris TaxID=2954799 RepID=A0A9X2FCH1_9BACT|nr:hypothetical protein [Aeoliella straminimaris]MCO6046430.1 hypothetical protein [Aeoliella straminimaris]
MHRTTPEFWKRFDALPKQVQQVARNNFALLKDNSAHPSLHFKKVGQFWSARVGQHYRALAVKGEQGYIWVWIGSHADYDKIVG